MPTETITKPSTPHPIDIQFSHFGVLNDGRQGRGSFFSSITINVTIALILLLLSAAAKKTQQRMRLTRLDAPIPVEVKKPTPPKPLIKLPKPPVVKVEPPKVDVPKIEVPDPPKIQQVVAKAAPAPTPTPAPPKLVNPPPAPKVVNIQQAQATSVANNNANPSPVRLGNMSNPINSTTGPAVAKIDLGHSGSPGMPAGNTGLGPASKINIAGSGSPNGRMGGTDNAARPVAGVKIGIPGGAGPTSAKPVGAVQIASNQAPPPVIRQNVAPSVSKTPPKVVFKPKPEYTVEARQMHLEGTVLVKIHVSSEGEVRVVGVTSGLGHGLDEQAMRAVQSMRFQPAIQDGHPIDWDGTVNINFQLAG